MWELLSERISAATGCTFSIQSSRPVSGGCINTAYRLQGKSQDYFVKLNAAQKLPMFEAEAAGLLEIDKTETIKVPKPICWGKIAQQSYLVLEYLSLSDPNDRTMEILGRQLAVLHSAVQPYFGWHLDNTIGSTPQVNNPCRDWVEFWRQYRLGYQLDLAINHGYGDRLQGKGERLLAGFAGFFQGYWGTPSLVHGDLWAGNVASHTKNAPVIFDPAVYYGDRETDLAMTELFGGFSPRFYRADQESSALDQGYRVRRTLYNVYQILNHLNLFGRGSWTRAERRMDTLLAEVA
jgi:fructosamine-3-kinase